MFSFSWLPSPRLELRTLAGYSTVHENKRLLNIELCVDTHYIRVDMLGRKNLLPCVFELSQNRQRIFKQQ